MSDPSNSRALPVPSSRLARLTQLGTMTAGVASNMVLNGALELGKGNRPSMRSLLLTRNNLTRVAEQLAKMRGAAMKVGQLVSMDSGEILPPELAQIMARLRDDAHFMPPAQLKQVLNSGWRKGWLQDFASFDVHPIAAASIGQVHRAKLKDGRDLAVKVQYPGVADSIDSDVANVGALIKMSGLLPKGFELAPYLEEARQQLHEETDYAREGHYLHTFGELLAGNPRFLVPALQPDWTTPHILAMSFVEGRPLEDAADEPQAVRDRLADELIDLTLSELFHFGLMQTDPNFANFRYDPETGRIILLDFGATRHLGPAIAAQYRALLRGGLDGDRAAMRASALDIGFFAQTTAPEHQSQILDMMDIAFEALRPDAPFDFTRTDMSRRIQEKGIALADAGYVPPPLPIDVLFLQRKLGGVFLMAAKLGARTPVRATLERFLER